MADTIGQQLKQQREARNLTIEKVVQATRIRARHLEAIEADDFESLPSPVQARAFLRLYAEFMGLSLDELIDRQRAGAGQISAAPPEPEPAPDPVTPETEAEPPPASRPGIPWLKKKPVADQAADEAGAQDPEPVEAAGDPAGEPASPSHEGPSVEAQTPEPLISQAIFTAIGRALHDRRDALSLTLDEIERHTHVRKHYLQALESGDFDLPPSSVHGRGMLSNYAQFLDLDVETILLRFAEGLQAQRIERQPRPDEESEKATRRPSFNFKQLAWIRLPAPVRRYLSADLVVGGGLVLLLMVIAIWGTGQVMRARSAAAPQPTAPSISDMLMSAPGGEEATATPSPAAGSSSNSLDDLQNPGPTLEVALPPAGSGMVQVIVIAIDRAWVRVSVDGAIKFEGRVVPGRAYPFDGNTQIEVLTGNGAAVRIFYNQNEMGPMGSLGEVVNRIYTANAILNPTPTFTPTITDTAIPSSTPRPSNTPRFSPTPTP